MADERLRVEYHTAAADEFEAAAVWYETRREGLGLRFFEAVERLERLIEDHPQSGAPVIGRGMASGIRRHQVSGFPFAVVYITEPRLVIVALAHARRLPGYWRGRLTGPKGQ
jgi:toxin ParE1/3/4